VTGLARRGRVDVVEQQQGRRRGGAKRRQIHAGKRSLGGRGRASACADKEAPSAVAIVWGMRHVAASLELPDHAPRSAAGAAAATLNRGERMRFSWRRVLLGWALASLAACGGGTVHLNTQNSVAAASASPNLTAPAPGSATLSWDAPTVNTDGAPLTDLIGYHIYYGDSPNTLTQSVSVAGAATLSYEITGLASGTWYFGVAADAADGTQSALSDVVSKTI
jgi:hypothetical protein